MTQTSRSSAPSLTYTSTAPAGTNRSARRKPTERANVIRFRGKAELERHQESCDFYLAVLDRIGLALLPRLRRLYCYAWRPDVGKSICWFLARDVGCRTGREGASARRLRLALCSWTPREWQKPGHRSCSTSHTLWSIRVFLRKYSGELNRFHLILCLNAMPGGLFV